MAREPPLNKEKPSMQTVVRVILTLFVAISAGILGRDTVNYYFFSPWTRDARVNPTFTWVRLAQRIPVRVRLTDVPAGVLIAAGMTCTVVIKESAESKIGPGVKKES
jgi:multidrug resistance efflux pump